MYSEFNKINCARINNFVGASVVFLMRSYVNTHDVHTKLYASVTAIYHRIAVVMWRLQIYRVVAQHLIATTLDQS
jgi:hypothetical protein